MRHGRPGGDDGDAAEQAPTRRPNQPQRRRLSGGARRPGAGTGVSSEPGCKNVPRLAPGMEPRQRPAGQEVKPLAEKHEDVVYHRYHMARVTAELVRPDVSGPSWGGYDLDQMKIAFLARAVQMLLSSS